MASYVGNKPLFGNFDKLDDISSGFNGSANTFAMTSNSRGVTAGDETQVVISLNGVIQEPVTDYFLATTGQIQFTTAPASGTAFFGYVTGNIGGTASTITDGIVTTAKLANTAGTGSAVQLAANTSVLTIAANGNIGIGTSSSNIQSRVNVTGSSTSNFAASDAMYDKDHPGFIKIENQNDTTGVESGIVLRSKANGASVWSMYNKHSTTYLGDLRFRARTGGTASEDKITFTYGGKLGIGTTSPSGWLEIAASEPTIRLTDSDNNYYAELRNNNGNLELRADHGNGNSGSLMTFTVDNSERMRIDSNGNVGIGAAPGSARFLATGGQSQFRYDHTTTSVSGNTDGTAFPHAVSISNQQGGADTNLVSLGLSVNTTGSVSNGLIVGHSVGQGALAIAFYTENSNTIAERVRIDNNGNLLVGKTSEGVGFTGFQARPDGFFAGTRSGGTVSYMRRETNDGEILRFQRGGTTVGSIQSRAGVVSTIILDPRSGQGAGLTGAGGVTFGAISPTDESGSETDAFVDIGKANYRFRNLYLSGGVHLGGTGSANYLDDYEEGTFDVTMRRNGNAAGDYTRTCNYTKIGKTVILNFVNDGSVSPYYVPNPGAAGYAGSQSVEIVSQLPFTPTQGNCGVRLAHTRTLANPSDLSIGARHSATDIYLGIAGGNNQYYPSNDAVTANGQTNITIIATLVYQTTN